MSEIKPEIMSFVERLSPRQQEYVLSRLAAGKDAYIIIKASGTCARCKEKYYKLQVKVTVNNVYFYHWNSSGKRCYLGPIDYIYVTLTHPVMSPLHGYLESDRIVKYIERIKSRVKHLDNREQLEALLEEAKDLVNAIEFRLNELKQK